MQTAAETMLSHQDADILGEFLNRLLCELVFSVLVDDLLEEAEVEVLPA